MAENKISEEHGRLIDGKAIAASIRAEIRADVQALTKTVPGLATVLVGERSDSATYVRMKIKACNECGMNSIHKTLPADASEEDVIAVVRELNRDETVHGIVVQLPLPDHINEENVLTEISIEKDVDGFHPLNIGKLAMKGRKPLFAPCTPSGCIELLKRHNVEISGKEVVVLGRSNIVGLPVSLLLLQENATVTIAHSRTANLPSVTRRADILIAAAGKVEMVKGDWLKPGCVIIDVGINSRPDATRKRGYRLVGDVDFEDCKKHASLITPVPGGVGPMTVAMLLRSCADAAMRRVQKTSL